MTRARLILPTLAALLLPFLVVLLGAAPASSTGRTASDPDPPLAVQLTGLSPSVIPRKGPIRLSGTVTNDSSETWRAINVHALTSSSPITSRAALAEAADTDPATTEIGQRLTAPHTFVAIGDLSPGETSGFEISVPRRDLEITGQPGVYWIGVHALGTNTAGRDAAADGRARTFIPLIPDKHGRVQASAAIVLPVRTQVRRSPDGRVLDPGRLATGLSADGRLGRITALAARAGAASVTWLIDPAVVAAAQSLSKGNPPLSLGQGKPPETPSPSPSANGAPAPEVLDDAAQAAAKAWLDQLTSDVAGQGVLGLGFGDPDTVALGRTDTGLNARAAAGSAALFKERGITTTPAVAPPGGWLDSAVLPTLGTSTTVLVSDHGQSRPRTHWHTTSGQDLWFTDARASSGGPDAASSSRLAALTVRQRILADSALRALAHAREPMVVLMPADWDPGPAWSAAGFFEGLQVPWLTLTGLSGSGPGVTTYTKELRYPAAQRRVEIRPRNARAANRLIQTGTVLSHLLDTKNDVAQVLTGAALAATSYSARDDPVAARADVDSIDGAVRQRMTKVKVAGTPFVILSGASGILTVTLVNDLDQPITVGLRARTGNPKVRIEPGRPVTMSPGQRTTARLRAHAGAIGVHQVTLTPVTAQGEPFGTPLRFSMRTSQVNRLFWAIIVAGGLLLVVMILRRIVLRVRTSRWRQ